MSDELADLINRACDYLDAKEPKLAKRLCLKAIEKYSESEHAWSNLAFAEIQLGNAEAAEKAAKEAISINSSHATAWHNLAESYVMMRRYQEALKYNERAIALEPDNATFYLGKGESLMGLQKYKEAIESFDIALTINPANKDILINRDVATLFKEDRTKNLTYSLIGISAKIENGEINIHTAFDHLLRLTMTNEDIFNADLVKLLDSFAVGNIQMKKPMIKHFCRLNRILASLLPDMDLVEQCTNRENEALELLG